MATMKAVYYEEYGSIEVMKYGDRPRPVAGPKDVVIEMRAAGVNPVDWKIRAGFIRDWPQAFPLITGWDVAGVVIEAGGGCTDLKVGDEVYSYARPAFDNDDHKSDEPPIGADGCCAQFVRAPEWKVARKPTSINFEEAGAVPLAGLTAYQALWDQGELQPGQDLLVLNASGGVGSFAVQFAKARGCNVIGTCSARNKEFVESLGATVVDYNSDNVLDQIKAIFPDGPHVVFDAVGGDSCQVGLDALKADGTIVSIANWDMAEQATAVGKKGKAFLVQVSAPQLSEIAALIDGGEVRVAHVTSFPLADYAEAFTALETHRVRGKIVLTGRNPSLPTALVVGASGTIGSEVVKLLRARYNIIRAGRSGGDVSVDMSDAASIEAMYQSVGPVDAVISCAGAAHFGPLASMTEEQVRVGVNGKLMGQVNLVLIGQKYVNDNASFTLCSGILSKQPIRLASNPAMVNAAIDGFVTGASVEMTRGMRINVVSPGLLTESLGKYGPYFRGFETVDGAKVARAYSRSVEGALNGKIIEVFE